MKITKILILFSAVFLLAIPSAQPTIIEYGHGHQLAVGLDRRAQTELKKGDLEGALRDANKEIEIDPAFFPARHTRARIFLRQRKWELVIQDCNVGLKQQPGFLDLAILRAVANRALGNYAASLAELNHVIGIQQERLSIYSWAFSQRAWLRATCPDPTIRNPQQAISDAKKACSLAGWDDADDLDSLAVAYASAGDFDSAVRSEQQAISKLEAGESARYYQEHLSIFQQHRPVR